MNDHFQIKRALLRTLLVTIIVLSSTLTYTAISQQSSSGGLELIWVKYGREGTAHATCVSGSTVYVVGDSYDAGVVEARDISTGEVITAWMEVYGSKTELYNCIVLGNFLYVVGGDNAPGNWEWLILKFTLDLKLVGKRQYNPSKNDEWAYTIFTDREHLYVGGFDASKASIWDLYTNTQWLLLELDSLDLSILKSYTFNPSGGRDYIYSGGVNPLDGKIWLVGSVDYNNPLARSGKLVMLDRSFTQIGTLNLGIYSTRPQLVFDELGYAYIASPSSDIILDGGLVKVSPQLKIVKTNTDIKPVKILYSDGYLYLARSVRVENYWRHAVLRVTKDLDVIEETVLSKLINADSYFVYGNMALANNRLFVTGIDSALGLGKYRWVIYSISTGPLLSEVMFEIKNNPWAELPRTGGTFTLVIYDSKWNYVTSSEVKYQGGEPSISIKIPLPYGKYNAEVYHKLSDAKIEEREMWGQYYFVVDKSQSYVELQRFFSIIKQFDYNVLENTVTSNIVLFYPGLAISPWDSQEYFISIILDNDLKPPYNKIVNSTRITLKSGETYSYNVQFTNIPQGVYYLLAISYWHNPWTERDVITDTLYVVINISPPPTTTTTTTPITTSVMTVTTTITITATTTYTTVRPEYITKTVTTTAVVATPSLTTIVATTPVTVTATITHSTTLTTTQFSESILTTTYTLTHTKVIAQTDYMVAGVVGIVFLAIGLGLSKILFKK